uniref:Uncharacterized protein MANES_05G149100 n=1 Tax=Rhizophora mucronata TaxID=61149 RepID=A0A2P2M102_RHIMU
MLPCLSNKLLMVTTSQSLMQLPGIWLRTLILFWDNIGL